MIKNNFSIKRLSINKKLAFHVYDREGQLLYVCGVRENEEDPFLEDQSLYQTLALEQGKSKTPLIRMEDGWVFYFAFTDKEENLYIAGPSSNITVERSHSYHYRKVHGLSQRQLSIPKLSALEVANTLSLALLLVNGECIDEAELLKMNKVDMEAGESSEWDMMTYGISKTVEEQRHLDYDYERKYLDAIRQGDVEFFGQVSADKIRLIDEVGTLAGNDQKQWEYMCISGITLVSRAAIDGGIPVAEAYARSEVYMQKIAKTSDFVEMMKIYLAAQKEFASLVKEKKERKKNAYYIEQCKDYVTRNIHQHISVEEMARRIGVTRSTLSGQFSKQVGMSISQYSIMVRLNAAENMLKFSDASVGDIAEYLCFSSQSHFGKLFKEKNGISPAEYRKQNRVIDFLQSSKETN